VTADGGGITLKGTTDKTINWIDSTDAWTFSEHVNIASGKEYRIAGTKVLDATSLGSAGCQQQPDKRRTISTGVWQGTAVATGYGGTGQTTYTDGQLLIGKTDWHAGQGDTHSWQQCQHHQWQRQHQHCQH
jgi:hypothetical protein